MNWKTRFILSNLMVVLMLSWTGCDSGGGVGGLDLFDGELDMAVGTGNRTVEYIFPHENGRVRLDLHYDGTVLSEMRAMSHFEDGVVVGPGETAEEIIYALLLEERSHNNVVYDVMEAIRTTSQEYGLNEVQLAVDFVQNIPYDEFASVDKYPVETLLAGTGDCSDKSLLLGQILEMMGYSCTLLLYSEAKHMALGLEVDGMRDDVDRLEGNMVFVETTTPHPIGRFPADEEGVGQYSKPVPIAVGLGGGEDPMPGFMTYLLEVDSMTAAYGDDYAYSDAADRALLRGISAKRTTKEEAEQVYDAIELEFAERKRQWIDEGCLDEGENISASCPEVVDEWNAYVERLNAAIAALNQAIDEFNLLVNELNA